MSGEVLVVDDAAAFAETAAERIAAILHEARAGGARVALAGGSTPRPVYERLAEHDLPWSRMEVFFGDERCVAPDDPASNFRMAREALLSRAPVPDGRVHRIRGELAPWTAAAQAEAELGWAALDLAILGIGPDGHTASLFPGAPALAERVRSYLPVHAPWLPQPWRVSMSLPALNACRAIVVLASGAEKTDVVARAVSGDSGLPAGLLRPSGPLLWILTDGAGRSLG